jgi:hypothetical protein
MSDKIKVTLSSTALEVNAGESVELTATIHNRSQIVDQFTIALEGLAPAWYDFSVSSVSLFPGDKDQIKLTIHPPKTAETKSGSYPFTVRAVSGVDPQQSTVAEASVAVRTFAELSADMSPTRIVGRSGTYVITLNNQGNADVTQSFEASDPEEGLDYTFKPEEVTVPAGGSATVELVAKLRKKPKVDGEKEYPFQVVVKPSGADKFSPEARTLDGQLVYERKARPKPKMPRWLIGVSAGVAAAIIVIILVKGCAGPPEIIEFEFDYQAADQGGVAELAYELHWVIKHADEVDINGVALEHVQLEEGELLVDPAITTVYVLTASNRAGTVNATIIIPPIISFGAEWLECDFGLAWTVKGADQVYLNGETVPAEGETTVYPDAPAGYNLTAQNEGGEAEKTLTLAPAAVTVTVPNGGETWFCGLSYPVTWTSAEPQIDGSKVTAEIHHVGLEYSSNGGRTWHPIDTNEPNDGTFPWTVPSTHSTTCLLRATIYCTEGDILGQDTSDDFFTIDCQCTADLLTPKQGEVIDSCETTVYEVTWEAEGTFIDHVKLSYRVGGGSWQTIATNLPKTGSYSWTLPVYDSDTSCSLRIDIYNSANNILCSDTQGFTILGKGAYVNLITPEAGATCVATSAIAFSWGKVACADEYDWVLSATADLSSPISIKSGLTTTAYTFTGTLGYDTTYYWVVSAHNKGDFISMSTVGTFTTVAAECTVELLTPEEGEWINPGESYEVTWEAEGSCIDHVALYYRIASEKIWQTIATSLPNTGRYSWSVPYISANCYLRIVIYDSAGRVFCSAINGPFLIAEPPM